MLTKALLLSVATAALSVSAIAADWQTLSNCVYVASESNDGDSFHVKHGKSNIVVRLNFVDTPESTDEFPKRVADQAKYFGITSDEAVEVGERAAAFTASQLRSNRFEVTTRWQKASGRSTRYYSFVHVGGTDLAELLVSNGLARVYGEANSETRNKSVTTKLKALELDAKNAKRGAWALAGKTNAVDVVAQDTGYKISSSGVRHNAKCRYYDSPSNTPCKATDGKPCKVCGG